MATTESLKTLLINLKNNLASREENKAAWSPLISLLESYNSSAQCFADMPTKAFFFTEFSGEIIKLLSKQTFFTNKDYKAEITKVLQLYVNALLIELPKANRDLLVSVRNLFDPDMPIYQSAFADLKFTSVPAYTPPIDPKWYQTLKQGTKVDAVKAEHIGVERVEAWAPATIKEISPEQITVEFDGMPFHDTYYHMYSCYNRKTYSKANSRLAPRGYRTLDWSWRASLKAEDRIDIFDTQGHWFLGTVLKRKNEKELLVGYRIYFPEGTKKDRMGRSHEGWSEQYDETLPVNSIRIQKPNSITKLGTVYCRRYLDNEAPAPDDSSDVLLNYPVVGDKLYIIHRPEKNVSSLYLELVCGFARNGGFDNIIKYVIENIKALSISEVFAYLDFMAAPSNLYHRSYVVEYLTPFTEAVLGYMSAIPEEYLRSVKRERLDAALTQIDLLIRRVYTAKTKGEHFIKLKIGIAVSLLRSDLLELRIQAIRLIAETCKTAKSSQIAAYYSTLPTANDSMVLNGLLQVPKVIEEIFGKRSHIELIHRSTEILSFFLLNGNISRTEFNVIWDCCEHDEQSKVEILKVISDSANLLPVELLGFIVEKYASLSKDSFKDQDIELLYELSERHTKPSLEVLEKILEIMWEVLTGEIPGTSSHIYAKILDRFCDKITSLKTVPEKIMRGYFEQVYIMLKEDINPRLALKILRTSLVQLQQVYPYKSKAEIISTFLVEGHVIPNLFADLERYHAKAKKSVVNKAAHREELDERIEFLLFALKWSNYKLSKENIEKLWELLVVNLVLPEDQVMFYKLFNETLTSGKLEDYVVSAGDLSSFFVEVMCNEKNNFQNLPQEGMQAIKLLLITINKEAGYVVEIKKSKRKKSTQQFGPELPPERSLGQANLETELSVKVPPGKIKGVGVLWKIVLEAREEAVTLKAMELLSELYANLADELEDSLAEISAQFVETAIEKLSAFYQKMVQENENRSKEIVTLLRVIEDMVDESERKGNYCITPLCAVFKGTPVRITLLNHAVDVGAKSLYPDKFVLNLHSKATLWQLKTIIAGRLNISPEKLRIIAPVTTKDRDNSKTLEELHFTDGIILKALKKAEENVPKAEILTKNKELTVKAQTAFAEIFQRFSTDGKMTPSDLAAIYEICIRNSFVLLSIN